MKMKIRKKKYNERKKIVADYHGHCVHWKRLNKLNRWITPKGLLLFFLFLFAILFFFFFLLKNYLFLYDFLKVFIFSWIFVMKTTETSLL